MSVFFLFKLSVPGVEDGMYSVAGFPKPVRMAFISLMKHSLQVIAQKNDVNKYTFGGPSIGGASAESEDHYNNYKRRKRQLG